MLSQRKLVWSLAFTPLVGCAFQQGAIDQARAVEIARAHYEATFAQEYQIANWEPVMYEEPKFWELMLAHPLPSGADPTLPRFGRVYRIDKVTGAVISTYLIQ
jgi:hypothetical protein